MKKHPIYPCLWFHNEAREAVNYYAAIFENCEILAENDFVVQFTLNGNRFMALNGRRDFPFNESVSFVITCDNQAEIDHYWYKLSAAGSEGQCGWLKDKYGVSWQVVPAVLAELMADETRSARVIEAFMKMQKFDIQALLDA